MEIWRDIEGYKDYQVSNLGRVRSTKFKKYRFLKPILSKKQYGYYRACLYLSGVQKLISIHRLVAFAFIPNPYNYPIIMHLDNDPFNNKAENLIWGTNKMNSIQMSKDGRAATNLRKLTDAQILEIKTKYKIRNTSFRDIAKKYNVSNGTISNIIHGITWKHI